MSATGRGPCDDDALKQLAVLPYVETSVVKTLRYGILGVPVLAIAFVGFGLGVLLNEIDELDRVKTPYRKVREACLDVPIAGRSDFRWLVKAYFIALLSLGIANLVAIGLFWIPPAWP